MVQEKKIKVIQNGPYLINGNLPLQEQIIIKDKKGLALKWQTGKTYKVKEQYTLCRCGHSKNKPFCDNAHLKNNFQGQETADFKKFSTQAKIYRGPALILRDAKKLCARAGFCYRCSGTWQLVKNSDQKILKETAIQQAKDCPSGRLVIINSKTTKSLEPKFKPDMNLIESDQQSSGPIWVRGGIKIESARGRFYEPRNRITLCRCGQSRNKPFCDGAHLDIKFSSKN